MILAAANTGTNLIALRIAAILGIAIAVSACENGEKPDLAVAPKSEKVVRKKHVGQAQYSALATSTSGAEKLKSEAADLGKPYVLQTAFVRDACLVPEITGILRKVKERYGETPIVTSGCRHGRGRSLHNSGRAVDIAVPGVSPDAVLAYARTLPEVGGTGRYRHTRSVHIDVGAKRQWSTLGGRWRFAMLAH